MRALLRYSLTCFLAVIPFLLISPTAAMAAVASRPEMLANPTSSGAKALNSVSWYPSSGSKKLARAPKGGFPVVVFLHGIGGLAANYEGISKALGEQGYIVVQNNTAQFNGMQQRKDGAALYHALKAANSNKSSFWYKSMNMSKVALSGHSMGGGSTVDILAKNPGYKAGFCFAPVSNFARARNIRVPVGVVMGEGDKYKWKNGENLFNALPKNLKGKFFYLMNAEADHQNVIRLSRWRASKKDKEVFESSIKLSLAFFNKHLKGKGKPLVALVNHQTQERRLKNIYQ